MKKFTLWLLFAFVALVANAGNFSVYLKIDGTNVLETSTVKVHVWDTDNGTTWGTDGDKLPQVTNIVMDVDGAKYFKYSFTDSNDKYSFLFFCDGKQSYDYGNAETSIVITYKSYNENDKKFSYTASTTAPVEPASVYLKGEVYGWNDNNGVKLEYNPEDKTYVYTETTTANLAGEFKILIDGGLYRYEHYESWNLADNDNNRTYEEIKVINDEKNMTILDAANFSSITIKVKKDGDVWKMQVEGTPKSPEDLISARWRGVSYNNWTNNNFTKNADGSFTYVVESPAGLANDWGVDITENGSTWTWYRLPDDNYPKVGTDVTLVAESTTGSMQIKITNADKYVTVTLTLKKVDENWVLSTSGTAKEETHTVTMKGAAWSWTGDKFTFTKQGDGTYAYTFKGNDKAGLAQEFAFTIDGVDYSYRTDLEVNTDEPYTMQTGQSGKNYKILTAADYTDITLTVAFSNGTPSLKVTGTKAEKTYPATVTIVGEMTGWYKNVYKIDHKGNGIYEGKFDTSTTNGLWRIYEQWDSSKGNSNDNWDNGTSWGYEGNQSGDNTSGTFTKGKKDNANTTTKRLWWLIFDINTGAWKLRESTSSVESIDNEGVKIVAGKGTITVSGATNVEVYTAGGALVSREAESHVAAGLYIVRTDNKVAKVIVR